MQFYIRFPQFNILLYAVVSVLVKQQKNPAPQDRIFPSVIPVES